MTATIPHPDAVTASGLSAPGPRPVGAASDGREAGPGATLPQTRRLERVPVEPGPMPPRWTPVAGRYLHSTRCAVAYSGANGWLWEGDGDEGVARDVADLLRWLGRGGR